MPPKTAAKKAAAKPVAKSKASAKVVAAPKRASSKEAVAPKRSASQAQLDAAAPALKKSKSFAAAPPALRKTKSFRTGGARPKVDSKFPGTGEVHGDLDGTWWDCMLNQTNVDANNNKYYIIQVVAVGGKYSCWTRWGRVGEPGQNSNQAGLSLDAAKKTFEGKFKDKTKNAWDNRLNFKPAAGKYTLLEMDHEEEEAKAPLIRKGSGKVVAPAVVHACTLEQKVRDTVQLIFNQDMFKEGLEKLGIDVDKMPLGKLSKTQVTKGMKVLEDLEKAIEANQAKKFGELTSAYYTIIPHNFGRSKPPSITTKDAVQKEFDMLNQLGDIATGVQATSVTSSEHPDDANYKSLNAKLKYVDPSSKNFKIIDAYTKATQGHRKCTIIDAFELDRDGEGARFDDNSKLKNRKLLWHGTSVPVVVAILKSGLRIMPHAGGRVGRGLYFASENGKSSGYVGTTGDSRRWGSSAGVGYMFLVEVALGVEKEINRDDSSLKKAPDKFDCVVARGRTEPDPAKDTTMTFDGKAVTVPQGKPIATKWTDTSFSQSEYLVYKESQARIRYMLKMQF